MKALSSYRSETLPQYRILQYLQWTGLLDERWAHVSYPDDTHVRVSDGGGRCLTFAYEGPGEIRETGEW